MQTDRQTNTQLQYPRCACAPRVIIINYKPVCRLGRRELKIWLKVESTPELRPIGTHAVSEDEKERERERERESERERIM